MNKDLGQFIHLINNLEKTSPKNSIFNYHSGRKAFLSLGKGNIHDWLESLLPNTRIILEPKIIGTSIGIQYINGTINKIINKNSKDITEKVKSIRCLPKSIPIKKGIELRGVVYKDKNKSYKKNTTNFLDIKKASTERNRFKFCAFQLFHCKINQFNALKELKNLGFEIPETQLTKFVSDIEIYRQCWKEGRLFQRYPTNGIVLKINSRKLQKHLGENKLSRHWAYAIN